ncbi:MAG: hypothetical protein WD181_01145 [Solirubrobacterales bacterium]
MSNPERPGATNPPGPGSNPARPVTPRPRVPVAPQPRPEVDLATRLDGQRGWLNELDRSLKKRSIIALILTCLAVGASAAALYISITKNSDADRINALETRIEAIEEAAATDGVAPATLPDTETPDAGTTVPPTGEEGTTGVTGETSTLLPATPAE